MRHVYLVEAGREFQVAVMTGIGLVLWLMALVAH
jgi:hypothetical protein